MIKKISVFLVAVLVMSFAFSATAFAYGYIDPNLPQPDGFGIWGGDGFYTEPGYITPDYIIPGYTTPGYTVSSNVSTPVIIAEPQGFTNVRGAVPDALRVSATSYDGGYLCYQWYASYNGSFYDKFPIEGANSSAYTPEANLGTVYYCVGVYNVLNGGCSTEVFSNIVPVTYGGIEIVRNPSRLSYSLGSKVDLSGLLVRVYDGGNVWESSNGNGLNVYPNVFQSSGNVAVQVSYGGSNDVFYVKVSDKAAAGTAANGKTTTTVNADGTVTVTEDGAHTHSFGEWEITKPATCVTTGTQTRSCTCGEIETEEIPRTDHTWDEGVITKEATASSNGARLYTCTVCKANKSEIIPAGTESSEVAEQQARLNIDGGAPEALPAVALPSPTESVSVNNTGATVGASAVSGNVSNNGSSGWWLIPVSALLLVGTGTGAYYIMRKKGGAE